MGDTFAAWQTNTATDETDPETPDLGPTSFDSQDDDAPTSGAPAGEPAGDQPGEPDDKVEIQNALAGNVIEDDTAPAVTVLNENDARQLTDAIRATVDMTYQLIARAHAGRAWEALGYGSWAAYVQAEFAMSRSRSYQLLDQSKVIGAIEAATPEGTQVHVTESVTRDIKSFLGDLTDELAGRTEGMTGDEATDVVAGILDDYHDRARTGAGPGDETGTGDPAGFYDPDVPDEFGDGNHGAGGYSGGGAGGGSGGAGFSGNGGAGGGAGFDDPSFDPMSVRPSLHDNADDEQDELADQERKQYLAAYDLYHAVSVFPEMPQDEAGIAKLVNRISEERRDRVTELLGPAIEWLTTFQTEWSKQPWAKEHEAVREAEAAALADMTTGEDDEYGFGDDEENVG